MNLSNFFKRIFNSLPLIVLSNNLLSNEKKKNSFPAPPSPFPDAPNIAYSLEFTSVEEAQSMNEVSLDLK